MSINGRKDINAELPRSPGLLRDAEGNWWRHDRFDIWPALYDPDTERPSDFVPDPRYSHEEIGSVLGSLAMPGKPPALWYY